VVSWEARIGGTAMNFQTKRVMWAALLGFITSIIIAAAGIMASGLKPWELDEYQITNPEVIAHWIGRLGFIPIVCVLVAVATSFRKAGAGISVLNAIAGIVGVSLVIGIGVVASAHVRSMTRSDTELSWKSGQARTYFVERAMDSCFFKQRSLPDNRGASDALLKDFCGCYANSMADAMTNEDMKYWDEHGNPSPSAISKMTASFEKCRPASIRN
jgi:hypothetical protein